MSEEQQTYDAIMELEGKGYYARAKEAYGILEAIDMEEHNGGLIYDFEDAYIPLGSLFLILRGARNDGRSVTYNMTLLNFLVNYEEWRKERMNKLESMQKKKKRLEKQIDEQREKDERREYERLHAIYGGSNADNG